MNAIHTFFESDEHFCCRRETFEFERVLDLDRRANTLPNQLNLQSELNFDD